MRRFDFRSPNDSYSWFSFRSSGVPEHTHSFDRDEGTSSNHLVEDRKQPIDMCLVIDNLDHDRQIRGQLDQTGSVDDAVRAKACSAVDDRGACETLGPESLKQRTQQRRVPPPTSSALARCSTKWSRDHAPFQGPPQSKRSML